MRSVGKALVEFADIVTKGRNLDTWVQTAREVKMEVEMGCHTCQSEQRSRNRKDQGNVLLCSLPKEARAPETSWCSTEDSGTLRWCLFWVKSCNEVLDHSICYHLMQAVITWQAFRCASFWCVWSQCACDECLSRMDDVSGSHFLGTLAQDYTKAVHHLDSWGSFDLSNLVSPWNLYRIFISRN